MKTSPPWSRYDVWAVGLLLAIGLAVCGYCGALIASFHSGLPEFRLLGGERLQYDGVWVSFLCGLSLLLYAIGMRTLAKPCAAVVFLIGALRLIAYIFPRTVSIHPILDNPFLATVSGGYEALGLLSALITVILGAALAALLPSAQRTTMRSVILASLASTVLALALLLAFGAWSGSTLARESLQLVGDDRINSAIFILLGATILIYTLLSPEHARTALGRFAPIIVGLALFGVVLVIWRAALAQETRFVRAGSQVIAAEAASTLERNLNERISILERLGERMSFHSFNDAIWEREGDSILRNAPELRSLAWSGPDYIVRWIAPPNPKFEGYPLLQDPLRGRFAQLATQSHTTELTPFTPLGIGGRGVIVFVPLFADDQFRGTISGALSVNWLESFLGDRFPDHYLELVEAGRVEMQDRASGARASPDWSLEVPITVRNASWLLRVTPTQDYVARSRSALPEAGLALGTAFSLLLALATHYFQAARQRARALNRANRQLTYDNKLRREAELRLLESEKRTQLIINSVRDCAIFMLDPDGRIATWSSAAEQLNGYREEQVLGQPISMLYAKDPEAAREDALEIATRVGWSETESWHQRGDGSRFLGDDLISAIHEDSNALRGFAVVTRDITGSFELRRQTEAARDHYFALFSNFPNLVWRSDPKGACDYLNQTWVDYTGVPLETQRGTGWMDLIHEEDRAAWQDVLENKIPGEKAFEFEFRLRRADQSYGSLICSGRPYRDLSGDFAGYLCSCFDNTERRAAEHALKESEERYQRITTNVPGMVFKLIRYPDGTLHFPYVSYGCRAVTGLPSEAVMGDSSTLFEQFAAPERKHLIEALEVSGRLLETWQWSGRLTSADGAGEKWISIRAKARAADEQTVIWDGVIFDDTIAHVAQLELEESREEARSLTRHLQSIREEEKARIAREVHDELGSTLTGMKMDLDWLADHTKPQTEAVVNKLQSIRGLLASAVMATRKIVTDLRPSILDDLGLASAMRWQIGEYRKHSELHFQFDSPSNDLPLDRARSLALFRIFQETVTNVTRHARASEVVVELEQSDSHLRMQIRDNGVGIGANDLRKRTSHGIRGMRERAEEIGGTLAVSPSEGGGTTVVVDIPLA